jgi:ferredoxin
MTLNINTLRLIYFSPTRTTQKVLEGISSGFKADIITHIDLTKPAAENIDAPPIRDGLTIIGAPVYGGRLAPKAAKRISRLEAEGAPAILIVLYGNREFEDALRELKDLAVQCGFKPIAGGAFIGEHSYANADFPIASHRPDGEDLRKCQTFGALVKEKLSAADTIDDIPIPEFPGNFPYLERPSQKGISPVTLEDACTLCGTCAEVCPVAAITLSDLVITQADACIRCCACVKNCPSDARVMQDPHILKIAQWLWDNCRQRKEPVHFI